MKYKKKNIYIRVNSRKEAEFVIDTFKPLGFKSYPERYQKDKKAWFNFFNESPKQLEVDFMTKVIMIDNSSQTSMLFWEFVRDKDQYLIEINEPSVEVAGLTIKKLSDTSVHVYQEGEIDKEVQRDVVLNLLLIFDIIKRMQNELGYMVGITEDGVSIGCRDITKKEVEQINKLFKTK